ncbi:MAG: esterase family protein [Tannerella sp.]|jgi:S-formylglutathione hydrolase FrmB|nr:esterase family protein [Tannerella sp.]
MKRISLLLTVLFCTLALSAQPDGRGPQSRVETKSIFSNVLNADREFNIYLPKSYDSETRKNYPVLYLLHGMNGTHTQWFDNLHVKEIADQLTASGEACEMIIVSPNAGGNIYEGAWNGYFDMPGWKYETFFFTELLPYIEKTYRVMGDKQHRAVAGLSMGGGGATKYAQSHSDMFAACYAMSALMNIPQQGAYPPQREDDKMAILTRSVQENSCVAFVAEADDARKTQLRSVRWYVDCGDDDFLLDRNIEFTQAMRAAQIPCEFRIRDGGHTAEYWRSALYTCLPFVTRCFYKISG